METTAQDVFPTGVRVHRPDGMPVWPHALRLSGMAAEDRHRLTALVLDRLGDPAAAPKPVGMSLPMA